MPPLPYCAPHTVLLMNLPPHLKGLHRSPGLTWLRGARRSRSSLTPSTLLSPSGALHPMPSTAQSVRTRSCVGICSGTPFPSPKTQYLRPEQCAMVPARGVTRCHFTREREQSLVRTSTRIKNYYRYLSEKTVFGCIILVYYNIEHVLSRSLIGFLPYIFS